MNDIEIGDYVRTNDGRIFRVYKIDNKNSKYTLYSDEFTRPINYKVTKHSKNIIDLIEIGDFVNNGYVYELGSADNREKWVHTLNGLLLYEEDIKKVETHEQHEQNCYTVERS